MVDSLSKKEQKNFAFTIPLIAGSGSLVATISAVHVYFITSETKIIASGYYC
ncbi:hypothetical protein fh0823_26500 [Francisella halioticida]|uniref:hypothetical protein n=1 Tax=Francisella halioticida TaxID=549298 RepID=UPI0012FA35D8|nr:hypothetical protein [Francisella halioticida]BCD92511.1 hypothetical protein fh0823_26500 [Francisella halioticida]